MRRLQAYQYELMPDGQQERQMRRFAGALMILTDRDTLSLPKLHDALGATSVRVQTFTMHHKPGSPDVDEIHIKLSRLTEVQFLTVTKRLTQLPGVREIKEEDSAA